MISGKNLLALKELYVGETAEIVHIDDVSEVRKRLRDMGLREGILIEIISFDSFINKKIILKIENSLLAFDLEIAEHIKVRPIKPWYTFYREQAFYDSLTGCLNRNAAFLVISAEYERSINNKIPMSMILFDVDDFKRINDTFGHNFGDKVLSELGSMFKKSIRRTDMVFRWGGEEFLILLKGLNIEKAYWIAERIRKNIQCLEITPYGKGIVRVSAGVDGIPPNVPLNELFEKADQALYAAKKRGKNQVCTFLWRKSCEAL